MGLYLGLIAAGVIMAARFAEPDLLGTVLRAVGAFAGACLVARIGLAVMRWYLALAGALAATAAEPPSSSAEPSATQG